MPINCNLEEMDKFLDTYNWLSLNHDEIGNLSRPLTSKEMESATKRISKKKHSGPECFTSEFCQTFKEELIPILLKLFKIKKKRAHK